MKITGILLIPCVLLMAGCIYEIPLTEKHNIPVDAAILGLWEPVDPGDEPDTDERMNILKFSDTEYLIHYPVGENGIYYRAYPIRIGQVSCIQLEIIGTNEGPMKKDQKPLFHAGTYVKSEGALVIKLLNKGLVPGTLTDRKALTESFIKHGDHPDLFTIEARFKRVMD